MNEIVSELLLPASYPSNSLQAENNKTTYHTEILYRPILIQVAKNQSLDLIPRIGSSTLLGHSIPFPIAKPSKRVNGATNIASCHPASFHQPGDKAVGVYCEIAC